MSPWSTSYRCMIVCIWIVRCTWAWMSRCAINDSTIILIIIIIELFQQGQQTRGTRWWSGKNYHLILFIFHWRGILSNSLSLNLRRMMGNQWQVKKKNSLGIFIVSFIAYLSVWSNNRDHQSSLKRLLPRASPNAAHQSSLRERVTFSDFNLHSVFVYSRVCSS